MISEDEEIAPSFRDPRTGPEPGRIANKQRRRDIHQEQKALKKKAKRDNRAKRKRQLDELGEKAPKAKPQKTLDNTREADETIVESDDDEVAADQDTDELAGYFNGKTPKVIVTTSDKPVGETFKFAESLINIIPVSGTHVLCSLNHTHHDPPLAPTSATRTATRLPNNPPLPDTQNSHPFLAPPDVAVTSPGSSSHARGST